MAKKKQKKNAATRRNTPLSKHRQQGKVLNSPLGGLPNMRAVPWLRDQFPDYLWVCWHLADKIDRGRSTVVATMNVVNEVLDEVLGDSAADRTVFDGSLTSWESLPPQTREAVLDALTDRGVHDLVIPETFAQALGMYPGAPGSWLTARWRARDGFRVDPEVAERALAPVIVASMSGRDTVGTQTKMLNFRALLIAEKIKFSFEIETVHLLARWPDELTDEERARVESFVRASFGATSVMVLDEEGSRRLAWARTFWQSNWRLYPCRVANEGGEDFDQESIMLKVTEFVNRANDQWEAFEAAATATDPDLYDPDRFEVLTGLTARSLRIATSAIHSPAEWTLEHSSASIRALIETLITVTWLTAGEDPVMYSRFKDYGRGRLKLLKLHWEEFADSVDDVPAAVQGYIDDLDRMVNQDIDEEFQNIDLGGSFSGLDTRKMAIEVGLDREYRLGFAPSSSDAHGEWGHLDRYVLTRCVNPTHRWHQVPRQSIVPAIKPGVMASMLDLTDRVIDRFISTIQKPDDESSDKSGAVGVDDQKNRPSASHE